MRFQGRCFRGHDPRWSFKPLSGEGAALTGGRFNRKGEPTLYTSLDIVTAVGECTQGFSAKLPPLLICEYEVDCDPVADLRTEIARNALGIGWEQLDCAWLSAMLAGKSPPSWILTDRLRADGYAGMLVPSFAPGATEDQINLVLWHWGPDRPSKVRVFDPEGRLPKDQSSWT